MQECVCKSCILVRNKRKEPTFLQVRVDLMTRFELVTSSLPTGAQTLYLQEAGEPSCFFIEVSAVICVGAGV